MTYCLAAAVDQGLVFVSDSRTNAGVDQLGTYSKMHWFFGDGERFFVLLSAGNLATTQAVVTALKRAIKNGDQPNLATAVDLDDGAECVGLASVEEQKKHRGAVNNFVPEASFIFGGQIRGQKPGIYHVYPEGNFVRASKASPYLQIGEVKYGKPILDRIIRADTALKDALTCGFVSMDSTLRSNATVGPPIEALIYRTDALDEGQHFELGEHDPYLVALSEAWSQRIADAFRSMPALPGAVDSASRADAAAIVTPIDRER